MTSLKGFSEKLDAWNRDVFRTIFRRKRRLRSRLEGIIKTLNAAPIVGFIKLERKLKREWTKVLL